MTIRIDAAHVHPAGGAACAESGRNRLAVRRLSVLLTVRDERHTLAALIRRVLECPMPLPLQERELIVVDDGSRDGTAELLRALAARDPQIKPVFHDRRQGRGRALQTAIQHMTGDVVLFQDSDQDPADLPRLVQPILDGRADAVFGSRFLAGDEACRETVMTRISKALCGVPLTDPETGCKAVRGEILRQTPLHFRDVARSPELTVRLAQWGVRLSEVPIRRRDEVRRSPFGGAGGALKAFWAIVRSRILDPRFTTHDGYYILVAVRNARGFNRWMYRQVAPFVGRRVLEAGSGIGTLTELLLDRERLIAGDFDPFYVEMLARRFGHQKNVRPLRMDLTRVDDYERLAEERLDTILCLNVLEHLAPDDEVLSHFQRVLQPGGHVIILVPQHPWLYAPVDRTLGHERRYTAEELRAKLQRAGFEVVHQRGFNKLGTLGWYVSGTLLGKRHLSPAQMRLYNRLLPLAKLVERVPGWPALSTIAVGRKPLQETSRERRENARGPVYTQADRC